MKSLFFAKLLILLMLASTYLFSKEYHIIAGSYSSQKNAEKMLEVIANKGINGKIIESVLPTGKFFRVSIGHSISISEVKSTLSDLSNKLQQKNLWILTISTESSQVEKAKLEQERIARDKAEKAKLEQERIAKENAEKAKLEHERIAKENAEKAKLEQERIARENAEKAKLEQEQKSKTTIISNDNSIIPQSIDDNKLKKEEEISLNNTANYSSNKLFTPYPNRDNPPENLNIADFLKTFKIIINSIERNDELRMKQYIHSDFGFILTYPNSEQKEIITIKSIKDFYESIPIKSNLVQVKKDLKTTRLSIPKVGSLPTFDCELKKFNGLGLFASQIKYLKDVELVFSNSNISTTYQSYLKVSDIEVVNSENKMIYSMYFTYLDGQWYLSMINLIPPCN